MRSILVLLILAVLLILTCGCSGSPPAQPAVTPAITVPATSPPVVTTPPPATAVTPASTASVSDNTITMVKNAFNPATMTVKAGSTVRWVNADNHPHRIEFEDKAFSASTYLLGSSQSASQRFDRAGSYNYSCMIHPYMKGTITVEM
jgi:plastocyanin